MDSDTSGRKISFLSMAFTRQLPNLHAVPINNAYDCGSSAPRDVASQPPRSWQFNDAVLNVMLVAAAGAVWTLVKPDKLTYS